MMPTPRTSAKDLRRELDDLHAQFPKLGDDELFVLWFLRAYVTDDLEGAARALAGGAGDKGVDAVFVDENAKQVFVVQGKYSQKVGAKTETRSDVTSFAYLAEALWGARKDFAPLRQGMSPEVEEKLKRARDRLKRRRYRLKLFYVTMGKCSQDLQKEAALIDDGTRWQAREMPKDLSWEAAEEPCIAQQHCKRDGPASSISDTAMGPSPQQKVGVIAD
jgi:hypothetical protein